MTRLWNHYAFCFSADSVALPVALICESFYREISCKCALECSLRCQLMERDHRALVGRSPMGVSSDWSGLGTIVSFETNLA
jgi:hypothetical protein